MILSQSGLAQTISGCDSSLARFSFVVELLQVAQQIRQFIRVGLAGESFLTHADLSDQIVNVESSSDNDNCKNKIIQ